MEWLFSWEVSSWVVASAIAVAFAFLALDDFKLAKLFFLIGAADASGGVIMWGVKTQRPLWQLSLAVFLLMGGIGALTVLAIRYVENKRAAKLPIGAREPDRTQPPPSQPSLPPISKPLEPPHSSLMPKPIAKAVTIKPYQVTFGVSNPGSPTTLSDTYLFRISNNSDDDVYAVSFKLRVHSKSLSTENFKFDVPKSSQKPIDENDPNASKFGDIGGMDCTDMEGRPVFFRVIMHLAPHESREVTLTHINPVGPEGPTHGLPEEIALPGTSLQSGIVVSAELPYFTTTPLPRLSNANITLSQIYLDEKLKCGAMSFIVLK
jgi:hypothetical protein